MRFLTVLLLTAIAPMLAHAQAPPPPTTTPLPVTPVATNGIGPRIQFDTENYETGTNMAGDKIYCTFNFTNTGDETLVLSNVKGSCGCTTVGGMVPGTNGTFSQATTWTHEVAPGKAGIIPVQIATDALRGQIHKTVTVTSNDRTRPNAVVNISGTVWLPIEVAPQTVSFALMPDATNRATQVVKIYNRTENPLIVWDPSCTTNAFGLELKTNVPGQEYELIVTAPLPSRVQSSLSSSVVQGEISLKTSVTNRNPLTITAFETVFPEITIFPPTVQVPAGPLPQPSMSHLMIRDNISDLHLSDLAVNVPGASVSLTIIQTNRQYYLAVTFPAGFDAKGMTNLGLTMKTDNPRFGSLTIPVIPVPGLQPAPLQPSLPMRSVTLPAGRTIVQAPGVQTNSSTTTAKAEAPQP